MDTNMTTNMNIRVSIIIPTYNRAGLVDGAIRSVLDQSYADWELIVIDDASTDDTKQIIERYTLRDPRIRYIRQPKNLGISSTRNKGIAEAHGTYIAMLDSDDVWIDKEKLAKQIAFLETHPDYVLVGTWIQTIDTKGSVLKDVRFSTDDHDIRRHILSHNQFAQSSVLFRKNAIGDGYDPALVVNEDYDLWLTIGTKGKFANISEYMTGYRVHDSNIIRKKRLLAARLHLTIIAKYRHDYPGFFWAKIKGYVRIFLAYFL
jgi:glycosyltransferase involved in cell wall biosynthesis